MVCSVLPLLLPHLFGQEVQGNLQRLAWQVQASCRAKRELDVQVGCRNSIFAKNLPSLWRNGKTSVHQLWLASKRVTSRKSFKTHVPGAGSVHRKKNGPWSTKSVQLTVLHFGTATAFMGMNMRKSDGMVWPFAFVVRKRLQSLSLKQQLSKNTRAPYLQLNWLQWSIRIFVYVIDFKAAFFICFQYMWQHIKFNLVIPGQTGCKNEADGGESVANEEGPYFVYFVFKTFQRPSNAYLMNTMGQNLCFEKCTY